MFVPARRVDAMRAADGRKSLAQDRVCAGIRGLFASCAHQVTFKMTAGALAGLVIRYIDGRGKNSSRRQLTRIVDSASVSARLRRLPPHTPAPTITPP
ncbi:hypothetical protein BN2475_190078 [Paraburkholderia ribeironis]|uniref:Uncharacterized protein n=1 Tax=Paraburkholderia ribeironis TaxID=1247936 RepID=A0A1N7RVK7_9BURK|nr:hypothetical protein BN2475_190078 [Paraburkholderia ribeironis]